VLLDYSIVIIAGRQCQSQHLRRRRAHLPLQQLALSSLRQPPAPIHRPNAAQWLTATQRQRRTPVPLAQLMLLLLLLDWTMAQWFVRQPTDNLCCCWTHEALLRLPTWSLMMYVLDSLGSLRNGGCLS